MNLRTTPEMMTHRMTVSNSLSFQSQARFGVIQRAEADFPDEGPDIFQRQAIPQPQSVEPAVASPRADVPFKEPAPIPVIGLDGLFADPGLPSDQSLNVMPTTAAPIVPVSPQPSSADEVTNPPGSAHARSQSATPAFNVRLPEPERQKILEPTYAELVQDAILLASVEAVDPRSFSGKVKQTLRTVQDSVRAERPGFDKDDLFRLSILYNAKSIEQTVKDVVQAVHTNPKIQTKHDLLKALNDLHSDAAGVLYDLVDQHYPDGPLETHRLRPVLQNGMYDHFQGLLQDYGSNPIETAGLFARMGNELLTARRALASPVQKPVPEVAGVPLTPQNLLLGAGSVLGTIVGMVGLMVLFQGQPEPKGIATGPNTEETIPNNVAPVPVPVAPPEAVLPAAGYLGQITAIYDVSPEALRPNPGAGPPSVPVTLAELRRIEAQKTLVNLETGEVFETGSFPIHRINYYILDIQEGGAVSDAEIRRALEQMPDGSHPPGLDLRPMVKVFSHQEGGKTYTVIALPGEQG
ncbi:MAG: hypothetical protein SFZ03_00015 [Candidatus Melainabacteria bacterium]|nr:hypothetical protein [Candidatus Melainabacteria bacterium]